MRGLNAGNVSAAMKRKARIHDTKLNSFLGVMPKFRS